jgi:hypothetical protein
VVAAACSVSKLGRPCDAAAVRRRWDDMWPSRLSALLSTARWSFGRRVVNGPRGAVVRVRAPHGFVEQFAKLLRNVRSHRRMAAVTQPCRRDPFQQLGIVQDVVPRQNSTRKKSALERHVVAWLTRPRAWLRIADRPIDSANRRNRLPSRMARRDASCAYPASGPAPPRKA